MRILVCGGRDFGELPPDNFPGDHPDRLRAEKERKTMIDVLDTYLKYDPEIISGMAKGADAFAALYARAHYLELHEFHADWKTYGKSAGYRRNSEMLTEGKPDLVIAFPGGKGTAMMVDIAKKAGVRVIEIERPQGS